MFKVKKLICLLAAFTLLLPAFAGCETPPPETVKYTVIVNECEGGAVTLSNNKPAAGGNVVVTAAISEGYVLDTFKVNGAGIEPNDEGGGVYVYLIKNIQANVTVEVTFAVAGLESISAVINQGGIIVWSTDAMSEVKQKLSPVITVNGVKNDSSAVNGITGYTLSCAGFAAGDMAVTVSYAGLTAVITVGVKDSKGYAVPFYQSDSRIDIGAWESPARVNLTQAGFDQVAEAGINLLMPLDNQMDFGSNPTAALTYLNRAHAAGLKVIVNDSSLVEAWHSVDYKTWYFGGQQNKPMDTRNVDLYKDHPAFAGIKIVDEPAAPKAFDPDVFAKLAARYVQIKALPAFKDKILFVNLCNYMGVQELTDTLGRSYKNTGGFENNYINPFFDEISNLQPGLKPDVLSYDNYMLLNGHTINNKQVQLSGTNRTIYGGDQRNGVKRVYMTELAYIRYKAQAKGVPAHNFLLTSGHFVGDMQYGWNYKDIGEADLRWQMAMNMAFGYQSFTHYCYGPVLTGGTVGADHGGYQLVIDSNGNPTALYGAIKTTTNEVRKWENVYTSFTWNGAAPVKGSANRTYNTFDDFMNAGNAYKTALSGISVTSDEDVVAGMFTDGVSGLRGFMLTNATLPPGSSGSYNATVNISGLGSAYGAVLVYTKGLPEVIKLTGGAASIILEAGEGKFIIPLALKQ